MADFDFANAAEKLAQAAVYGERGALAEVVAPFVKQAEGVMDSLRDPQVQRYLLGGLGGGALGAALGAAQPDKEKRKRNMLYYGAFGGLGGLGLAHLANAAAPAANSGPQSIDDRMRQTKAERASDAQAAAMGGALSAAGENAPNTIEKTVLGGLGGTAGYGAGRLAGRVMPKPQSVADIRAAHRDALRSNHRQLAKDVHSARQNLMADAADLASEFKRTRAAHNSNFAKMLAETQARHAAELGSLAPSRNANPLTELLYGNPATDPLARRIYEAQRAQMTAQHANEIAALRQNHAKTLADARRANSAAQDALHTRYNGPLRNPVDRVVGPAGEIPGLRYGARQEARAITQNARAAAKAGRPGRFAAKRGPGILGLLSAALTAGYGPGALSSFFTPDQNASK